MRKVDLIDSIYSYSLMMLYDFTLPVHFYNRFNVCSVIPTTNCNLGVDCFIINTNI